jgi:hypothetical protein
MERPAIRSPRATRDADWPAPRSATRSITRATLADCRDDLTSAVLPDQDTAICGETDSIHSAHLMGAAAAQNYGQTSYRIRQPFDFADREGTIVFDAEAAIGSNGLWGFLTVAITADPIPAPSFASQQNSENSAIVRDGVLVELTWDCAGVGTSIGAIHAFRNFVDTSVTPAQVCIPTARGKLNHFELHVSNHHIELFGTPASADGVTFEPLRSLGGADLDLPFSRGYVHLDVHNHATLKYSAPPIDAWTIRFDNVGFDGPVVNNTRDFGSPLNGTMHGDWMELGNRVPRASDPPAVVKIPGVRAGGIARGVLAYTAWYLGDGHIEDYVLNYRLNGNAWHERPIDAAEAAVMRTNPPRGFGGQGALGQQIVIDPSELVDGDNTLELTASESVPQNYPPAVLNVDLVLTEN